MAKLALKLDLSLHVKQLQVFSDNAKVRVICAGRGFGKSVLMLITAIAFCLTYTEPINPISPQVALIAMPTLKMARAIFWIPILNMLEHLPIVENIDKQDFRVVWKGARPDLILRGADRQGDRLRGLNLCFAGLDEYQDFHPDVWKEVLIPALTRNRNWRALVIGTPKGKASHFYKFHEKALKNDDWKYYHFVTADNPFISRREIARAKRELPPKTFRQEFLSSWEEFDGQLLPHCKEHHKASAVPQQFKAVLAGGDWGDINIALVVVGITHQGDYYLLDTWYPGNGSPITSTEAEKKAAELERLYGIVKFFLPDDRPASVLSMKRYGLKHKLKGMARSEQVMRSNPGPKERAIIVDSLFYQDRLWFGPKTHHLYDKFASYHRAKDGAGNLTPEPAKRQDDHEIDATAHVLGQLEGKYVQAKKAA